MEYTNKDNKSKNSKDKKDSTKEEFNRPIQTDEEQKTAMKVQTLFRGSYNAKEQIDLMNRWATYDDYVRGIQNEAVSPDHPASVTNIIKPIIDSQISDLVDKPFAIGVKGEEPSDHLFADDVQHLLEFILDKNEFLPKLTQSERDRLELGTTIIKVYTDMDGLNGKGLPTFEIISPANFFPDPKWTASRLIQECEFVIHAVPRPLSWIRKNFPEKGKYVQRQVSVPYDPTLQTENFRTDEVEVDVSQKALLIECYMKDENGELYCVHIANDILLEDSRTTQNDKIQRRELYPFVVIPCYTMRGTGWGQGDVEVLKPIQDMINDFDDQIRMNARVMGNPQIVVGRNAGKGFDMRKWTNAAGLKIPMQDVSAFKVVPPVAISSDVVNRRDKGFQEADLVSGRPDVNRGETGGGVTAASAIIALQNAGQKVVVHKSKIWKEGWKNVLGLLYDEVVTNWDEGMWVRINGSKADFKFIDPAKLKKIEIMIPNLNPMENEDSIKKLMDDVTNEPMTREAEFDLEFSIGDGLPNDKAFMYQTVLQLAATIVDGKPVISWAELREFLREELGMDLKDEPQVQPPMNLPQAPIDPMMAQGGNQLAQPIA